MAIVGCLLTVTQLTLRSFEHIPAKKGKKRGLVECATHLASQTSETTQPVNKINQFTNTNRIEDTSNCKMPITKMTQPFDQFGEYMTAYATLY